jgi:hypothetical protein
VIASAPSAIDDEALLLAIEAQCEALRTSGALKSMRQLLQPDAIAAPEGDAPKLPSIGVESLGPVALRRSLMRSVALVGEYYHCVECDKWHANLSTGFAIADGRHIATCLHVLHGEPSEDGVAPLLFVADFEGQVAAVSRVVASDAAITPWERLAIATTSAPNMSTRVTISERTAVRAVLDVYVSPHGCEEFWYSNVPNALGGEGVCAGGAYREVEVLVDGIFAGAAFPFPVIYSGGINPVLWRPIAGLHSLNVPPLTFDLTPFVGVMDDGLPHTIDVRIAPAQGSQSSGTWYVDPVLRLWHAADGLTRTGRVVKAERVAVSTTANVERLAGDSVRVLTSEVD